jgi:hypothetical protein
VRYINGSTIDGSPERAVCYGEGNSLAADWTEKKFMPANRLDWLGILLSG